MKHVLSLLLLSATLLPASLSTLGNWDYDFVKICATPSAFYLSELAEDDFDDRSLTLLRFDSQGYQTTESLPSGTFSIVLGPNENLFAAVYGTETGTNPSLFLSERTAPDTWTTRATLSFPNSSIATFGANLFSFQNFLAIDLEVNWSYQGPGTVITQGSPPDPALILYDLDTGELHRPLNSAANVYTNGELIFASPGSIGLGDITDYSSDGLTWHRHTPEPALINFIDEGFNFFGLFGYAIYPDKVHRDFAYFFGPQFQTAQGFHPPNSFGVFLIHLLDAVSVGKSVSLADSGFEVAAGSVSSFTPIDGTPVRGSFLQEDLAAARNGESTILSIALEPFDSSLPLYSALAISDDYLATFQFHQLYDLGHLDSQTTDEHIFLLRKTETGTTVLLYSLPEARIPLVQDSELQLSLQSDETSLLPTGDSPSTFVQLQTSNDLSRWTNLGLPVPSNQPFSINVEGQRFFRPEPVE